ncbi:MAG: hypothetical protein MJB14_16770 [Spirochaetes bacterium]|nr:hypothetical protein [Spirochaetota bacterium]
MGKKSVILIILSLIIWAVFTIVFIGSVKKIPENQDQEIEVILGKISRALNNNQLNDHFIDQLPKNKFFVIWQEKKSNQWVPIIYDNQVFQPNSELFKNSFIIPDHLTWTARWINRKVNTYQFRVWVNKYEPEYYITNVVFLIILFLIIYAIVTFLVIHLISDKESYLDVETQPEAFNYSEKIVLKPEAQKYTAEKEEEFDLENLELDDEALNNFDFNQNEESDLLDLEDIQYDEEEDTAEYDFDSFHEEQLQAKEETDQEITAPAGLSTEVAPLPQKEIKKLLQEYQILWQRNFKISPSFQEYFPFAEIYDLLRFSITPEQYINRGLEIASAYFHWEKPGVYISQKDYFIENRTKEHLDESKIHIPVDGSKRGKFHIPLYPYQQNQIFGYFVFEWQKEQSFYIADILYFLKFLFSEDARYFFVNANHNKKIKYHIDEKMTDSDYFYLGLLRVDNKERLMIEQKPETRQKLDQKIYQAIKKLCTNDTVFQIFPYYYGFYGTKQSADQLKENIRQFIHNDENNNYFLSNKEGNIAISLSCGLSFKDHSTSDMVKFIEFSENKLLAAIEQGGQQLITKEV